MRNWARRFHQREVLAAFRGAEPHTHRFWLNPPPMQQLPQCSACAAVAARKLGGGGAEERGTWHQENLSGFETWGGEAAKPPSLGKRPGE